MANKRLDPVTYRPFRSEPLLAEGLLAVARDNGDLERRVAAGLARMADTFGERADRQAAREGALAGARDAAAGAPGMATVTGGQQIGSVSASAGTGVRVVVPPAQVRVSLSRAAQRHGVDETALMETARLESNFNPNAKNPNSSAGGILQFIDSTARQYGLADKFDLEQAADAGARLMKDNAAALTKALGRAPTAGELYLAHQQGSGGAIKLLANPFAKAADLVGADAVRLNGGSADMSANDFANLWIGKVNGGGAPIAAPEGGSSYTPLPAASVAPISVTPIATPVTVTPGKAGTFRPSGSDTIYGRAYTVEGTRTYLEELDLTMRADQAAVYEAYQDDPDKLQDALGELETAHMRESVFDEIAPDYSRAFRSNALTLVSRARSEKEKQVKAQARVEFLDRVGEYEDRKAQTLAGIDPRDPEAGAALADVQASIDAHYDGAVARGVLTPGEAALAKRQSRSDGTVGFYVKQAGNLRPDEIGAMRAEMQKDFAAGALEGVSAADWDRINEGLAAAQKARETQDVQANSALVARGNDLAKRIASGQPVTAEELARFQLDAGTAPKGGEIVQSTLARMRVSDAIRKLPIGQVEKLLPKLLAGEGGTARPEDIEFARGQVEKHRKELATDPLGVAERFGVLPMTESLPIGEGVTVDQAESAFGSRMADADAAAAHFGVQPRYFRPQEKAEIKALVATDPDAALAIAAGVVSSAGPKASKILAELGTDAPGLEQAGTIMVLGGDANAARDLIAGYGKTPDGKAYPEMPVTKQRPVAAELVGSALVFDPAAGRTFQAGAGAIARKRLYDAGIDPKSADAKPIFERALNEAAGATFAGDVQFGGFAGYDPGFRWKERQVVVPGNIRADLFVDVVGALTDADLGGAAGKNGKAWRASDFQNAMPVRVDGGHVFALGDPATGSPMFISDASGRPIVLDFEGDLGKRLAARIPEAFR